MRAAAVHAVLVMELAVSACGNKAAMERPAAPWFQDVAASSGINFIHQPGATGQFYMPEIMGSGAALLDYDGDGDLDVLLLQAGRGSRLYRNELIPSGHLQFTDVTDQAGFDYAGYGMGVATGDFDNDGRIDVLITGFGGNALYRNLGGGVFRNVTAESPDVVLPGRWSTEAAFFDYDRDG